jgi:hypothetical protein
MNKVLPRTFIHPEESRTSSVWGFSGFDFIVSVLSYQLSYLKIWSAQPYRLKFVLSSATP